jgi:hypothetical protein
VNHGNGDHKDTKHTKASSLCGLCVFVAFVAIGSPAAGQTRPLQTEEATTAPGGRIELELGQDFMKDEPNFLTGNPRNRFDGPILRLVYSPADSVEIDLEWVTWIATPSDPDLGSVGDFGDVTLRTKLRFIDGGERGTTLGARYVLTLPQTEFEEGLGPNTLRMSAQLLLTQPLGPVKVHLNAGLAIEDEAERPHFQRDLLAFGAALEGPLAGSWRWMAEVAGKAGDGTPGTDERIEARAGVAWDGARFGADAAVRRGLADADGTWGVTAGLRVHLRDRR